MEKTVVSRAYRVLLDLLHESRQKAGMTQEVLAERLGVTQSFVSKCERGERRLDILETMAWAEALEIPFQKFAQTLDSRLVAAASKRVSRRS